MKPYLHPPGEDNDLFAVARKNDPSTSHEAAASVMRIKESQAHIMVIIGNYGPLTDEQIYARMLESEYQISPSGCRTRRSELVTIGKVTDSGARMVTKTGRRSIMWSLRRD